MRLAICAAIVLPLLAQDWPYYGANSNGWKYSSLNQINRTNVAKLKAAWTFHTGEISDGAKYPTRSAFETTPLMVNGILYLTTPFNRLVALDPDTGVQRWASANSVSNGESWTSLFAPLTVRFAVPWILDMRRKCGEWIRRCREKEDFARYESNTANHAGGSDGGFLHANPWRE